MKAAMTDMTRDEQIAQAAIDPACEAVKRLFKGVTGVDVEVKIVNGEFIVTDPCGQEFNTGLARKQ